MFIVFGLMFLLIVANGVARVMELKGVLKRGTTMWKFYIVLRILPAILGVAIAAFVVWYFLGT